MQMMVKVKFVEAFKDGTILGGKFFAPNTVAVISENDVQQIRRSGGLLDVIENVIPNPLKTEEVEVVKEESKAENAMTSYDATPPASEPSEPEKGRVEQPVIKGNKRGRKA